MKHLLKSAQLTDEDFAIQCQEWRGRDGMRPKLYPIGHSMTADRRDAELMLRLPKQWTVNWQVCAGPIHATIGGCFEPVLGRPLWAPWDLT